MEKKELIEELTIKLNSFSFYNKFYFDELKLLSEDDVFYETTRSVVVTPLLEIIRKYALIYNILSKKNMNDNFNGCCGTILGEAFKISQISAELFDSFFENNILHPSILINYYINSLIISLKQAFDCAGSLFFLLPMCSEKDRLYNLITMYDNLTVMRHEKKEEILSIIFAYELCDDLEKVLDGLAIYSDYVATLKSGFGDSTILCLSNISLQLSLIKGKNNDIDIIDLVDGFTNRYIKNKMLLLEYNKYFERIESYKEKYKKMD